MTVLSEFHCLMCAEFADAPADGDARVVLVPGGADWRHPPGGHHYPRQIEGAFRFPLRLCPPRHKSRVRRLKAQVEDLLT